MEAAPEPSARAPGWPPGPALGWAATVLAALVGSALLAAVFAGDGSDVDGILPAGGAAVVLLGGAMVASAFGWLASARVGRAGAALVLALLLLVAWTGATVAWSIVPDRSWESFNKSVAFAAFLGLGVVLAGAGGRLSARLGASMLSLVTGVVLTWALVAKAIPSLDPGGDRVARLREPVGYWNALALLADIALALGLWLGASRGHRLSARVAGGLLVYLATLSLLLTLSRVGVVAGLAVVVLWLALSEERAEGGLLLAASAIPAALVAGWAFTRPALVEDVAERSDRVADGAILGILALAGALLVAAVVAFGARRELGAQVRKSVAKAVVAVAALGVTAALVGLVFTVESSISADSSCSEVVNDPSRLGSLDLSNRWCWWNEAVDVYVGHAPEGAGAGTFEIARKRYRTDARNVVQPHSVPLQQLADGGVVAFGLFLALVLAALAVCAGALRRLEGGERAAAVALVAVPAAYLLHALVDYDWDFLAVTSPTMAALGVLAAAGRRAGERRGRPVLGVGAVLLVLAVLVSFSSPRLADRSLRESTKALDDGDFQRARDQALWARFFNPLSVDPLLALARISERRNFHTAAERRYVRVVELQPENPETWYVLGFYEFRELGNMCAAYGFLNTAYTLDPAGDQWIEGGALDIARDAVNNGACEPG
ncbi:MAG: O-antigen ligase family protein [Gaiellaceae bacterium]